MNDNEYHVVCGDLDIIVNLRSKSCKCKVFDVEKLPCIHVIAAAEQFQPINTGEVVYSLCSEYYSVQYFMLAYAETIYPVPSEKEWTNIPEAIRAMKPLEPDLETKRGRPRMSRFPSQGELPKKNYKCSLCGQIGHNAKRCQSTQSSTNV